VEPVARIEHGIAQGISHASREQNSSLIVMGWGITTGLRARVFGGVIDRVLWASHCPVAVTRLLDSPSNIRRILVPIENFSQEAVQIVRFAEILANANQAEVTLLHVCDRRTSRARIAWIESQLNLLIERYFTQSPSSIKVMPADNVVSAILNAAKSCDLVVLRSRRRRVSIGQVAVSDVTTDVVRQLQCSIVLLGEPQGYQGSIRKARVTVKKVSSATVS
jgi:nucleotide-binding universal stress UspA family protein